LAGSERFAPLVVAFCCVMAAATVYVLSVLTPWGQSIDDRAIAGWRVIHPAAHVLSTDVLGTADAVWIAVAVLLLTGVSALRGLNLRRALAPPLVVGGSLALAELLKAALGRPHLTAIVEIASGRNSFPSGHAAIAAALAASLLLVVPGRFRPTATVVGILYASLIGAAVLFLRWHRPSDVIGGYLVATAWATCVAAALDPRQGLSPPGARGPLRAIAGRGVIAAAAAAGLTATAVALVRHYESQAGVVPLTLAFCAGVLIAVATVAACLQGLAKLLNPA